MPIHLDTTSFLGSLAYISLLFNILDVKTIREQLTSIYFALNIDLFQLSHV